VTPMMVMVFPALVLSIAILVILARSFQEQLPFDWVRHHGFVSGLFLFLDSQHGVFSNFGSSISDRIGVLQSHKRLLLGGLFQLLIIRPFDQSVNPSLAQ
jgi:hypothetical protein